MLPLKFSQRFGNPRNKAANQADASVQSAPADKAMIATLVERRDERVATTAAKQALLRIQGIVDVRRPAVNSRTWDIDPATGESHAAHR